MVKYSDAANNTFKEIHDLCGLALYEVRHSLFIRVRCIWKCGYGLYELLMIKAPGLEIRDGMQLFRINELT